MFGIDLDKQTPEQIRAIVQNQFAMGHLFYAWETYSHTDEKPRMRILIPFAIPVPLADHRHWSRGIWPTLAAYFHVPDAIDRATKDPARLFYLPSWPINDSPRDVIYHPGKLFEPRSVIADVPVAPLSIHVRPAQQEDLARPVDIELIRNTLAKSRSKHVINLLAGKPLTPPSSIPGRPHSHYEAWRSVTASVANVLEGWESRQVILDQLIRPSWIAEELEEPNPTTSWDVVCHLFQGACDSAPTYHAERLARIALDMETLAAVENSTRISAQRKMRY